MIDKLFGETGVRVPAIGQGTWDVPERGAAAKDAARAIQRGIELGMTHIDTAEMYGSGRVEEFLAGALESVPRERLFVTTKVLPSNASYRGTLAAADRSLHRLKMDYVDLYLLHWPSDSPLEETMRGLARLVADGKARFVGVSNFDAPEMLQAAGYLDGTPLACNQVLYHLHERTIERRVIPAALENGIAVVGYTPFGRGRFPRSEVLDRIGEKHGATPRQVILAFLTRFANAFAIPKASKIAHVEENAGAGDLRLDPSDVADIDAAFPATDASELPTL
ncbi:MAG TPA: aldo/keto reductase [Candidatus Tumulicola sp.]|jgi:diketogulonate reductase-like aldo/keto reductase